MKKVILFFFFIITLWVPCFAQTNTSETLTITTYYPSPYGVYKNLRLHPTSQPTTGVAAGVMFYNNTSDTIMYYNKTNKWVNLTEGGGGVAGGWEYNITTGHVYNVNPGHIGIGTNDPSEKLSLMGTAGDPVRLELRGPHPDLEFIDTGASSAVQISSDGNLFEVLKDNAGDPNFSSAAYLMAINIPSGNVGIGTSNPQQKLDVNGSMRLAPSAAPPAGTAPGSVYYDSTKDTLRYRDSTAPAQWNNFISESGKAIANPGDGFKTVNFRKAYVNPPIVVATPVVPGIQIGVTVTCYISQLTNTFVVFDLDSCDVKAHGDLTCRVVPQRTEIHYIVISNDP